jgi:hypothetical protein
MNFQFHIVMIFKIVFLLQLSKLASENLKGMPCHIKNGNLILDIRKDLVFIIL